MTTISAATTRPEDHVVPTAMPSYIRGLDGMRAISVVFVIIGHAGFAAAPSSFGVTIFFFISGFLITNLLISEYAERGRIDLGAFYVRRYLRLMPELAAYILVGLVVGVAIGAWPRLLNILGSLFYFTNYLKALNLGGEAVPFVTGHLWSLAVEEHFYLTWPLAMIALMPNYRAAMWALVVVMVAGLAWKLTIITTGILPAHYIGYASETRFDSIAYGCFGAFLFRYRPALIDRLSRMKPLMLIAGGGLLLIPMTWRTVFGVNPVFQEAARYTVQGLGFIFCFVYLYAGTQSRIVDWLETAPMRFTGRASYGMYIWHYVVVFAFTLAAGYRHPEMMPVRLRIACAVLAILIGVLLGHYSARYVLAPFAGLRRRYGSHLSPSTRGA